MCSKEQKEIQNQYFVSHRGEISLVSLSVKWELSHLIFARLKLMKNFVHTDFPAEIIVNYNQ